MANTYVLIASNTLGSSAASVTFSSIPSTYTDLVLKWSTRDTASLTDRSIRIRFNSDTGSNYSVTYFSGNGSSAASANGTNNTALTLQGGSVGSGATSNTFSNGEVYIPNYLSTSNKPVSGFTVPETNAATFDNVGMSANALLYRNSSAVTSIDLLASTNFASGSSFFLYGIKNS